MYIYIYILIYRKRCFSFFWICMYGVSVRFALLGFLGFLPKHDNITCFTTKWSWLVPQPLVFDPAPQRVEPPGICLCRGPSAVRGGIARIPSDALEAEIFPHFLRSWESLKSSDGFLKKNEQGVVFVLGFLWGSISQWSDLMGLRKNHPQGTAYEMRSK